MAEYTRRPRRFGLLLLAILVASPRALDAACLEVTGTEATPGAFALDDFDRDGQIDIVIACSPGRIVLHRGLGDARFGSATSIVTGTDIRDVISGDFDEDGSADLVVVDRVAGGCRTLRGRGDGTFESPVTINNVGTTPISIASGDFDENGILDLALLNDADGRVYLQRGLGTAGVGNGTFQGYVLQPFTRVGSSHPRLRVLDVDGDGILDLTANVSIPNAFHQIALAYGTGNAGVGNGYFESTTVFNTAVPPSDFRIADLDLDGRNDLVLSYAALKYVEFHQGLAGRAFGPYHLQTVATWPSRLAITDLDMNGRPDVAFSASDRTGILPIDGPGSTWPTLIGLERGRSSLAGALALEALTIDDDLLPDLVMTSPTAAAFAVQVGECAPSLDVLQIEPAGLWGQNGRMLATAAGARDGLTAVSDSAGGAFLTWRDRRAVPAGEIFVTRIGPDGLVVPPWTPGGRVLRPPATGSPTAAPVADAFGGVYVVVGETKDGESHLWAHHLSPDGSPAPGWPIEGLQLDGGGFRPYQFLQDGNRGLIVVGVQSLSSTAEIRVRRYGPDASTATGWPAGGVTVTAWSSGTNVTPGAAASDGTGGVYVCWDTYVPAGTGHGGGQGHWGDDFAYVRDGTRRWHASASSATGFPSLVADGQGRAFGSYTSGVSVAYFTMWTPSGGTWTVPSPFDLWSLYGAGGDGSGGAVVTGRHFSGEYRICRIAVTGGTPFGAWVPEGNLLFADVDESLERMCADLRGGSLVLSQRPPAAGGSIVARYISNLGSTAPSWPGAGHVMRTTTGRASSLQGFLDGNGGFLVFWIDPAAGAPAIYGQRFGFDQPVPIELAYIDHEMENGVLLLRWYAVSPEAGDTFVERRLPEMEWAVVGQARVDGSRLLVFADADVRPGEVFEYRIVHAGQTSEAVRISIPGSSEVLSLAVGRQPARAGDALRLSLANAEPARLEVYDVRGRLRWTDELEGLAAGRHDRVLPRAAIGSSGIYWVRLRQGTVERTARLVYLD